MFCSKQTIAKIKKEYESFIGNNVISESYVYDMLLHIGIDGSRYFLKRL
jgi:hypothetical protein